jgi:hypothetical protein
MRLPQAMPCSVAAVGCQGPVTARGKARMLMLLGQLSGTQRTYSHILEGTGDKRCCYKTEAQEVYPAAAQAATPAVLHVQAPHQAAHTLKTPTLCHTDRQAGCLGVKQGALSQTYPGARSAAVQKQSQDMHAGKHSSTVRNTPTQRRWYGTLHHQHSWTGAPQQHTCTGQQTLTGMLLLDTWTRI